MDNIINLQSKRIKREGSNGYREDLTHLVKNAVAISTLHVGEEINGIFQLDVDVSTLFKRNIADFLLKNNACGDSALFKCSLYVSDLIAYHLNQNFKSYYMIDFLEHGINDNDPMAFKEGGDLCFMICSFFNGRKWRMMKPEDYFRMGASFYAMFYDGTKKEIGWHMSQHYTEIVKVTQRCLKTL